MLSVLDNGETQMGIVIPRPPMRARERRTIEAQLNYHHDLMTKFIADGMSREDASAKAYEQVKKARQHAVDG